MLNVKKDASFAEKNMHFGVLEVEFPEKDTWNIAAFEALKAKEVEKIKEKYGDYERKALFGENPYYRYFKKYKKTYPVMQELESLLLKGRPFPSGNPINEIAFITELKTQRLIGSHDIDRMTGDMELFCPDSKIDFEGMGGRDVHTYPGDVTCRDNEGIFCGMIGGADNRTCLKPGSNHIAYLVFGTVDTTEDEISDLEDALLEYVKALAPNAVTNKIIV